MSANLNLTVTPVSGSENPAVPSSQIDVVLTVTVSGPTYNQNLDDYGSITIDSTTVTIGAVSVPSNSTVTLYSARHTIVHNPDGTKTVSVSAAYNLNTSYVGWLNVSGSTVLPTIPRATVPYADTTAIGNTMTIRLPRASANFTHRVLYYFGSLSGTLAEAAGDQLQWTIPMDFCAQLPNATSGTVQISCSTYNGSE
ncbi:MAG: DUF859 family phage minor structural protein, partial [Oscillibacter sp.]|nr:DUF859 family phage minor structural protein [Oscillibacter sp.]